MVGTQGLTSEFFFARVLSSVSGPGDEREAGTATLIPATTKGPFIQTPEHILVIASFR